MALVINNLCILEAGEDKLFLPSRVVHFCRWGLAAMWLAAGAFLLFHPAGVEAFPQEPHHTAAYISDPGEIDILASYSSYSTRHFWNREGDKLPAFNHFASHSFPLYAEYALNPQNSFSFNGGYTTVHESLNGKSQALNDFELGWKHLICSKGTGALTAQLIAVIPAGRKKPSIRYGVFAGELALLYSNVFCLKYGKGWYDLKAGFRWYQRFPSDQILLEASLGYGLFDYWLQVIATAKLDYGLYNGKSRSLFNNIVFDPNYRLLTAKIESVLRLLANMSVTAGYYHHVWGRNVGTGGGFIGGAWIDF